MRVPGAAIVDLASVDLVRLEASGALCPERRAEFGQYMTSGAVARFMAGLFSRPRGAVRLLDPGAGVGSLTAAFVSQWGNAGMAVTAYEVDPTMVRYLRETLGRCVPLPRAAILESDFIRSAVFALKLGRTQPGFTHAILNPPYKKINSDSEHRALLRAVGLETVNLYTAFTGLAIELMAERGELVAIIPRSFCNGPYYQPFRKWLMERASIEYIHLFHSRASAFRDDDVLQENIVIKLVRGSEQGPVTISTSSDTSFTGFDIHHYPFGEIVNSGDQERIIHIPTGPDHCGSEGVPLASRPLRDIGIEVSTGPVVDFRLRGFLRAEPSAGTVPLLYPFHFSGGGLAWPRVSKKANAIVDSEETSKWLYPSGFYTVVRRFSSKEETRRIVAHVVDPAKLRASAVAFENHLNVFHAGKAGLSGQLAHGLAAFLNSTAVDEYFRRFSGHTQVNATDLRRLHYPERSDLDVLGAWVQSAPHHSREQLDQQVRDLHARRKQDR